MKLHKNSTAQMGTMELVISVAIGLIILAAVFSIAPIIGDRVDNAVTLEQDAAATGTLTFSGNTSDGETVNISTDRYEFDVDNAGVTTGNIAVAILPGTNNSSGSAAQFTTTVGINDSVGVGASVAGSVVTLTADTEGTAGNSIATTETCVNATFGTATTLTGGTDATAWSDDSVPTGVDIWGDNASLISLVVLVMIISLAIFYIRRMGGGGGGM